MPKLAVKVVLLPPDKVMDRAIELNQTLNGPRDIVLSRDNCIPHISMVGGCVEVSELDIGLIHRLQEVAREYAPLRLVAETLDVPEMGPGNPLSVLWLKEDDRLNSLRKSLAERLRGYFTYEPDKSMFVDPDRIDGLSLSCVSELATKNFDLGKFKPHITLGFGETTEKYSPISFVSSRLAMYQFGHYGTCGKWLLEETLKP